MLFVKKLHDENPHKTIREMCEGCDVSIGTAERIVHENINLRKKKKHRGKMDTSIS